VDEETEGDPHAVAEKNARRKAAAVPGELVLGADTIVALDGDILGKPRDADEARAFVARLNGRTHEVVGGIALVARGGRHEGAGGGRDQVITAVETTRVSFRRVEDAVLDWYVATGEWRGRAGGYAIQGAGAALVAAIEGDYLNVVGLPLARLLDLRPTLLETAR
jgi:septum formation protein